jgi:hypothetical protein
MMGFIYIKLLKIVLILSIGIFVLILGINEASARGWLKSNPLEKVGLAQATWQNSVWQVSHLPERWGQTTEKTAGLNEAWQQTWPQLTTLKDRSLAAADVAQTFVETQVIRAQPSAAASNSTMSAGGQSGPIPTLAPLEQRALDYAKYVYCRATVTEYEQLHPEVKGQSF